MPLSRRGLQPATGREQPFVPVCTDRAANYACGRAWRAVRGLLHGAAMSAFRPVLFVTFLAAACGTDSAGGGGGDDEAPLECPADTGAGGAITFDGVDDHAKTELLPKLGLETFTIEAWVRRDGDGVTYTTGAGGLRLVPIAGKGLGEGDGSNVDCNYGFGFWGDVLGADFEDAATGANHPVTGKTAIARGEWHHVAATFDGMTWRLYVDGMLDAEAAAAAMPRADSIHAFGIGTAIDSKGAAHGYLAGALDELRVWNKARTQIEIADSMYRSIAMGDGL